MSAVNTPGFAGRLRTLAAGNTGDVRRVDIPRGVYTPRRQIGYRAVFAFQRPGNPFR